MIMTFQEVDDVNNENYKQNIEEDHEDKHDDDKAKLVLIHRIFKHYNYDDGNFIMLIFDENENNEEVHESQTPWLLQHLE